MTNTDILNDQRISYLADLFLAHLKLDKRTLGYRRLKNAVILLAELHDDTQSAYVTLADIDGCTPDEIRSGIYTTFNGLRAPADALFNEKYCDDCEWKFMPPHADPDDTLAFLGKTFKYILETNYRMR